MLPVRKEANERSYSGARTNHDERGREVDRRAEVKVAARVDANLENKHHWLRTCAALSQ